MLDAVRIEGRREDGGFGGGGGHFDSGGRVRRGRGDATKDAHAGVLGWQEVDIALRQIARRRAGLDAEEARWLLRAWRADVHRYVGCGSFAEYVERVLGHGPRACAERLRVAEALEGLATIEAALARGELAYSAVRELTRVATPVTEMAWLDAARGRTVREVEDLVSGHEPGDWPDDPPDPVLRPHVLRFEVAPEEYALFREAERRLRAQRGRMVTDGEMIDTMCRALLAELDADHSADSRTDDPGASDASRKPEGARVPYQIALTVCARCDRTWQDGAGRAIEVGPEVAAMARCDAQVVGHVDGSTPTRASRTIPPAVRRQVVRRDHGRCIIPGCRASRWIEVHHVIERSRGGVNDASNLACLCSSHHSAVHRGLIEIAGGSGAWEVRTKAGSPWGFTTSEPQDT